MLMRRRGGLGSVGEASVDKDRSLQTNPAIANGTPAIRAERFRAKRSLDLDRPLLSHKDSPSGTTENGTANVSGSASRSRQIAINAASQWGVTILSAVLGLMMVPFLIAKLGKDGYGLIAITIAIAGVCTLADLGISGALGRQLSEALASDDNGKYQELLSTSLGLNLLVGLTCVAAISFSARLLAKSFALPGPLFDTGVFLLRTYGATHVLLTFVTPTARAVLASHNRFDISSQIDAVRRLFETGGLFLVLASTRSGIAGWAIVCIAADAICAVLLWRAAAKTHPGLRVGISTVRASSVHALFRLGSQFTLLQLSGQLSVNADPFILTACLGPGSVSLYRPPAQVFTAVSPLVAALANQLHPLATRAHVQGETKDLAAILVRGTKYTMLMGAVFCAIVISLAYPLCRVWLRGVLGQQYTVCASVLTIQAVTQLAGFAAGTQWPVLLGMKRTAFAAYGRLALAFLNIASSWMLVRYTTLGVMGVVIPTMLCDIAWRPAMMHYTCRSAGVSIRNYLREAYTTPVLIGAVVGVFGVFIRSISSLESVCGLAAAAAAQMFLAAGLIWFVGFNSADRLGVLYVAHSLTIKDCASVT